MVGARKRFFLAGDGVKIGLWLYILLPPLGWLVIAAWPQGPERFGLQWQALGLGICCALLPFVVDGQSFRAYLDWLKRSKVWLLLVLGSVWLLVMGFIHGFVGLQLEGLLSGALFLALFPLACFAWLKVGRDFRVGLAIIVALLLLLENFFLSVYLWRGLGFGVEVLDGVSFPRIFLNIRDGNTIAIGSSVVAFTIFYSARKRWWAFALLTAVFFNGWITAGRGLFVSVWFGILLVVLRFAGRPWMRRQSFSVAAWSAGALCMSWLIYCLLSLAAGANQIAFQSMVDRMVSDSQFGSYGRLFIWREWIVGGFESNVLFGSGLGVRPVVLPTTVFTIFTPHNIFVQLISEGGLWSVFCIGTLIFLGYRANGIAQCLVAPSVVYGLGALLIWLNVSAMVFWPLGVWLISSLGALCFGRSPSGTSSSEAEARLDILGSGVVVVLLLLIVALISKKLLVWP